MPSAEEFGDGPGLGDAGGRFERRFGVEDLGERTEAVDVDGSGERLQEVECCRFVLIDAEMSEGEGTEEPAPDGALMIGGVAVARTATIVRDVSRFVRAETAKAEGSEKFSAADIHDGFLLFGRERARGQ